MTEPVRRYVVVATLPYEPGHVIWMATDSLVAAYEIAALGGQIYVRLPTTVRPKAADYPQEAPSAD
jgi:hypothetical protein